MNMVARQVSETNGLNDAHNRSTRHVVADHLMKAVEEGVWAPGDRLPSVRALASTYRVSVLTMTRSIQQLVARGVLRSEPRKGVYVCDAVPTVLVAGSVGTELQRSFIRRQPRARSLSVAVKTDSFGNTINLASGTMAPDAVPSRAISSAIRRTASSYVERSFSTTPLNGELELRNWITDHLMQFGIRSSPDNVVIVNGSQQGRKLLTESLINPGDTVLIEQPTYPFALSTFEAAGAKCIGVPVEHEVGLRIDMLEQLARRHHPKLFYTVSTGQIPTGLTLTMGQRRQVVDIASDMGFLIVEADAGNELSYDGPAPHAIKSLDPGGLVVYLKSFSRIVAAGLRVGCVIVEGPLRDAVIERKRTDDLFTSPLSQEVFRSYVTSRRFHSDLAKARDHYLTRRNAALAALAAEMPEGVSWTRPTAGLHIWLTLPAGISSRIVAHRAIGRGVVVAHGEIFMPNDNPDNGLRITFSDTSPDEIAEGVRRLARVISEAIDDSAQFPTEYVVEVL